MKKKIVSMFAAGAMAFGAAGASNAFMIDLSVVNGGAGPGFTNVFGGDGVTGDYDQLELSIEDNYVTIFGWFTDPTHSVGDKYSFSEVGLVNYTGFLPATVTDDEQYRAPTGFGWELNGDFNLTGTAELTAYDSATGQLALDFKFTGGTLSITYDEIVNGKIDGTQVVVTGTNIGGAGNATQFEGGDISDDLGSFDADFAITDLLDGFLLQSDGKPFLDGKTLSFSDGNIDQTVAVFGPDGSDPTLALTGDDKGRLVVLANSNGSQQFAAVPEPGTMVLLGSGLLGLAGFARRRAKKS